MRKTVIAALAAAAIALPGVAGAADTVKIANLIELSGNGAAIGRNWTDAVNMAVEEINAAGGDPRQANRNHRLRYTVQSRHIARAIAKSAGQ